MNFLISKKGMSFQSTLKLHKNHNLNHFALMHSFLRRLCPQPPGPNNTVGKLSLVFLHVLLVLGVNLGSLLT
jgi:hypothetical protein